MGVRAFPALLYAHKPQMAESLNDWARDLARDCHSSARASLSEAAPSGADELEQIADFILTRTA